MGEAMTFLSRRARRVFPIFLCQMMRVSPGISTRAAQIKTSFSYTSLLSPLQRTYDFVAVPVVLSVVLMMSDGLLTWSASSGQHRVLLWPWLILRGLELVLAMAALVAAVVFVPKFHLKVEKGWNKNFPHKRVTSSLADFDLPRC